ncbi:MAG TPA: tetratricopeptide repeat protein [Thermoanaerobaculia bacterium]|jgi:tetratricopeptide (TPR) repeat protein
MTVQLEPRTSRGTYRIIEAPRGAARAEAIDTLLVQARLRGDEALHLSCRLATHGAWAGVADICRTLLPHLDAQAPELVRRHSYELALAVPELRRRFPLTEASLTDGGPVKERVRSYPVDRAYRLVHGLIDLLDEWLPRHHAPLFLVCDEFDEAGALVQRFFRELVRRRLDHLPLELVFVGRPGLSAQLAGWAEEKRTTVQTIADDGYSLPQRSAAEFATLADELETRMQSERGTADAYLPMLVHACAESGQRERAQRWRAAALATYNHFGFYEDALFFGQPLIPDLDITSQGPFSFSRWHVVSGLFNALVALGQPEEAYRLVHDEALLKVDDPKDLISIYYTLSMLHCRFLPQKDLAKAEEYLHLSLGLIDGADLEESEKHYLAVFNLNGLAFIRHLQGRVAEATELCEKGYARLDEHLSDEQYRLHRSVLLYNIAQVHSSTRSYDQALAYYTAAMEIDPRYSEYYNERGNVYLKIGRYQEAVTDYHKALELSAPYYEVWTNLGQAYKLLGDADNAARAYTRALDLDPRQLLPLLGRAQTYELTGRAEEALADYTAALELDGSDALVWANRAVLHYECGRIADSVADLNRAIERAPKLPDLYANRAVALGDLGRHDEAARDEEMSRRLQADA